MTRPFTRLLVAMALAVSACGADSAPAKEGGEAEQGSVPVVAAPPASGEAPSADFMADVYAAAEHGGRLYDAGRYAEALPHLVAAAERGFKVAQASAGDIYLNGRGGVPRHVEAGIGWLGAAADAPTLTRIADYFKAVRQQLPADYIGTARVVVERYRALYGGETHRVVCRRFGEVVEDLRCHFMDDPEFANQGDSRATYARDDDIEEMVVTAPLITAPAPDFGKVPSGEFISQVYDAASRGRRLYNEGRFKEALPLLIVAAKRGFKWAQASAADIYLHGRGDVPADLEAGIGWLGVAAQPKTSGAIERFFGQSRALLPERFTPEKVDRIVADYRAQYGHLRHRVACRNQPVDSSWSLRVKNVRCHFIDEATQCRQGAMLGEELEWQWTCAPMEGSRAVDARPY